MFERRGWFLVAVVAATLLPLPAAATVAQDATAAAARAKLATLRDSLRASQERVQAIREAVLAELDSSMTIENIRVVYPSREFVPSERERVRDAIARTRAALTELVGPDGPALLDGDEWTVFTRRGRFGTASSVTIRLGPSEGDAITYASRLPLDIELLDRLAQRRAAQIAVALHPAVEGYVRAASRLDTDQLYFYFAQRQLAVSQSARANRCAEGILAACRDVLSMDPRRWYDAGDPQPTSGGRVMLPFTHDVRASLLTLAVELDGPAVLRTLRAGGPASADPIALIASAVDLSADELLEAWQAKRRDAAGRRAAPSVPLAATSLIWTGLLLVAVARRRPR